MRRNKHLILWSSLGSLVLLMWAAYEENALQDWRVFQTEYRQRLAAADAAGFSVELRQIVVPGHYLPDSLPEVGVQVQHPSHVIDGVPIGAIEPGDKWMKAPSLIFGQLLDRMSDE